MTTAVREGATQRGALDIFRHRDFTLFFSAASISNGGSWMQLVAVQALLYQLTNSGTWLGFSTVVSLVPAVILTPYAGVLADRISRMLILKITQTVQMVSAFALWGLYIGHAVTPWWIIVIGFVNGVSTGFQSAAWQSFVPLLVPDELMLQAVRLNSVQYTLARAIGPAIGGIVVRLGGFGAAIMVNAITYLLVIAVLLIVHPRANVTHARAQKVIEGLKQGAVYIWQKRPLRLAVILALLTSIFGQSLQYVGSAISERLYHHSANGNAGLLAALGIGAVASSGLTVVFRECIQRSLQTVCSLVLYSGAIVLMVMTHSYAIGQLAYFLLGICHLQLAIALGTLIQGGVSDEYRGRATSFYLLGVLGGIPIGSQIIGSLGDAIGFRPTLLLDAACFALLFVVLFVSGQWRDLDASLVEAGHT
ncbi:MAG TPA: MFS transporter [Ilumatobacteraceae bacterium]